MTDPVFNYVAINPFGLSDVGYDANPTFVDIDNDGDSDVLVGNSEGNTLFFRNTGTASNPVFTAAIVNPFGLIDIGFLSSPDFVDIDGDGDLDAFVGEDNGNTLFFRNTGTINNPNFAVAVTNPFGLNDVGDHANPIFVDIDGDGDLDAFVGNYTGHITFFRNTGSANNPIFAAPVDDPFGLVGVGWYGVNPTFVDIDNDSDLDAFLGWGGDYNSPASTFFYRNIGTVNNPVFNSGGDNPFGLTRLNSYYHISPTFVDIDRDNDLDIFMGDYSGNLVFYQNTGLGRVPDFSWTGDFGLNNLSFLPNPTFVDIDGDGDLDAFVGQNYTYYGGVEGGDTLFFKNTGTVNNPAFADAITNPFGLKDVGSFAAPTFVDIDKDGDSDAFIGNESGNTLFFKNTGTAANPIFATPQANPFGLSDIGINAMTTFVDIDADNDMDAFVNNIFFENIGNASNPSFAAPQTNPFGLSVSNYDFVDIDVDGDLDAFAGAGFFRNTGTATNPIFTFSGYEPFGLYGGSSRDGVNSQTFVDIDGDGDFDVFMTGSYYYAGEHPWGWFYTNYFAPKVTNLNTAEIYSENTPLDLTDIVVSGTDSASITATLTLSNSAAGHLTTATSGAVTSTYNSTTGVWTASGALADVNALLAGVVFTPTVNFKDAFTINTSISDGVAAPLFGSKSFTVSMGVLRVSTSGNDILTGTSSSNDTVTYVSATGSVTVSLNTVTQQDTLGAGLDTITKIENLIGSAFADNLTGNSANNILEGKGGNDTLIGWSGADTMIGSLGNDTYFVENTLDVVTEKLNEGTDTVSSRLTYTLPVNVENLIFTGTSAVNGTGNGLNNIITGNNAANQLNGYAGNDTLKGGAGDDILTGWSGADIMLGGLGSDTYFVENVGDVVTEKLNEGTDVLSSRLTYTLAANVENLTLTGTTSINGTGNGLANVIIGNNAANQLNGAAGNDTLSGESGNDILNGSTCPITICII